MPYSSRTGYIIKVQGNSYPEYDSAVHFTLTNASAPLGQETEIEFTIDQVSDNRYLVWVALLRDALVHHLVVDVGYYYAAAPDPGIGKVTYVRLISDPCGSTPQGRQGFTTQKVKAKLTSLTLNQFIVEYEAKTSFLGPCLGSVDRHRSLPKRYPYHR